MEGWTNDKVVDWVASKGFGVWTPFFRVRGLSGRELMLLSVEDLLEAKLDKITAKKIIAKRDRLLKKSQSSTATCYPTTTAADSDPHVSSPTMVKRLNIPPSFYSSSTLPPLYSSSTIPPLYPSSTTPSSTSTSISSPIAISSSSFSAPVHSELSESTASLSSPHLATSSGSFSASYLGNSGMQSLASSYGGGATSPIGTSPNGSGLFNSPSSPELISRSPPVDSLMPLDGTEAAKKRRKGKKKKLGKYFGKKEKKGPADEEAPELSPTASDDSSEEETEGVGTPYNVAHHLHVEFHAELGFTGLPLEWKARFEEPKASKERLSPFPITWTVEEVTMWLENLGFGVYGKLFSREKLDGKRLVMLTADNIRSSFPSIPDKHMQAIIKQVDLLRGEFPKAVRPCKVFGVALETVMKAQSQSHPDLPYPVVLHKLYGYIREHGLHQVGIFRLGPSVVHMREFKDKIDETMDVVESAFIDAVIPSALVKLYFRELPHPVITHEAYAACIPALDNIVELKKTIDTLPANNYALLKHTLWLLYDISKHKEFNHMGADNLAKVFGPTLLWQNTLAGGVNENPIALVQKATDLVETCIGSFPVLFLSDAPPEVKQFREGLALEGPLSPPPNTPRATANDEDEDAVEFAETAEITEPDLASETQFPLDDVDDDNQAVPDDSPTQDAQSYLSESVSSSFQGDASSVTSYETVIIAPSDTEEEDVPDSPSSQSSRSSSFSFNISSSLDSSHTSSINCSTDSLILDDITIPSPKSYFSESSPVASPPITVRDRSHSDDQDLRHRSAFVDQAVRESSSAMELRSSTNTVRERSNSKEPNSSSSQFHVDTTKGHSPPVSNGRFQPDSPSARSDRSNSKDQSPLTIDRARTGPKEQACPPPPSQALPINIVRERNDSKEPRNSPRDQIRASPRDQLATRPSPRDQSALARPSPREQPRPSPRDLVGRITPRDSSVDISPPSPRDPPTPRGLSKPQEFHLPRSLSKSLIPPPPPSTPANYVPEPEIKNEPAPTLNSPTLPPPPPPTDESIPPSSPQQSHTPLLRRLTFLVTKETKKDRPITLDKNDVESEKEGTNETTEPADDIKGDKKKEKEEKRQRKEEKKKEEERRKEDEKRKEEEKRKEKELAEKEKEKDKEKVKKGGSLFFFNKKPKETERERSRSIFAVPPPPSSLYPLPTHPSLQLPASSPLKRSASVGLALGGKGTRQDRSLSVSNSLLDP